MAFGEGIETMLSLHEIAPRLPLVAGLSAAHLAALEFAAPLRRLYVARERDGAGPAAFATLAERTAPHGTDVVPLHPRLADFNSDLLATGHPQLDPTNAAHLHILAAPRTPDPHSGY